MERFLDYRDKVQRHWLECRCLHLHQPSVEVRRRQCRAMRLLRYDCREDYLPPQRCQPMAEVGQHHCLSTLGFRRLSALNSPTGAEARPRWLQKALPIRLLMYDPLPDCDGGGGTTVFPGS